MTRVLCLALLASMLAPTTDAAANQRHCDFFPLPASLTVPENPSFILDHGRVEYFGAIGEEGQNLPLTVAAIDDHYVRVTVEASHGQTFTVAGLGFCWDDTRFEVSRDWTATRNAPEISNLELGGNFDLLSFSLDAQRRSPRFPKKSWRSRISGKTQWFRWMRIDWAYSERDLEAGLHGTFIQKPRPWPTTAHITLDAGERTLFVRITPLLPNGEAGPRWQGWITHQAHGSLLYGEGSLPAELVQTTRPLPALYGGSPAATLDAPARPPRAHGCRHPHNSGPGWPWLIGAGAVGALVVAMLLWGRRYFAIPR